MCGIFGYDVPTLNAFQRGILASHLARLNDERGGHSWGAVGIGNAIAIHRGLGDLGPDVAIAAPYSAAYFHTRWATQGERTIANAHPFEVGAIVGAHNGMIHNHDDLNARHTRAFAVDSQHLFAHLNEGRAFTDLEGYGSIQWIDRTTPDRIYLSRLQGGELSIMGLGTADACTGIVWSSDGDHLVEALLLAGIDRAFDYEVGEGSVLYVDDGALYATDRRLHLAERRPVFVDWRAVGRSGRKARKARKARKVDQDYKLDAPIDPWDVEEGDPADDDRDRLDVVEYLKAMEGKA